METRILLLSQPGEACDTYCRKLDDIGVSYDVITQFSEYFRQVPLRTYNGLLFDVSSLVRLDSDEKNLAHDLINIFPALRLKWDPVAKRIRTLFYGLSQIRELSLENFISETCKPFQARAFRNSDRIPRNLNVRLSRTGSFDDADTLRSFTANVSPMGAFIVTMEKLEVSSFVWLQFLELEDQSPIQAEIRWSVEWGKAMCIPGIGVKFVSINDEQREELNLLTKKVRKL